jgi:hypothetical protein
MATGWLSVGDTRVLGAGLLADRLAGWADEWLDKRMDG